MSFSALTNKLDISFVQDRETRQVIGSRRLAVLLRQPAQHSIPGFV